VLGSQSFQLPSVPPPFLIAVIAGGLAFGAIASLAPGVRASRTPPAEALREA
jgi:putative ABC transport system permease protein